MWIWIWIWIQVYVAFAEIVHAISELSGNCLFCVCRNTEAFALSCYTSTHSVLEDRSLQRFFFSFYLPKLTEVREEFSGFLALRPRKKHRECGEEN